MPIQTTPDPASMEAVLLRESYVNNMDIRASVISLWSGYNGQSIELELMPLSDTVDVELRRAVSSLSKKVNSVEQMRSIVLSISRKLSRAVEGSDKVSILQCLEELRDLAK